MEIGTSLERVSGHLISGHGGEPVSLLASPDRALQLQAESLHWLSHELTARQLCDLELLLNGGFSPLRGFMPRGEYESVCSSMRLSDGTLWPIPISLDVSEAFASQTGPGESIALRDPEGVMLAVLRVQEMWKPDRLAEAEVVYGTASRQHPGVAHLLDETQPWYLGGHVEGVRLPTHYDFRSLRLSPIELRNEFACLGWQRIVAFQTRNPMHRAHQELTLRAARQADANVLLHPVVGMTKPGDIDYYTRVRCYRAVLSHYPKGTAKLALLPLAMRMAGPKEALWHARIRKNYGCTHLIVGRDHAGPGVDSTGRPFYQPYAAQELLRQYEGELAIQMLPFNMMVYVAELDAYVPDDEVPEGSHVQNISGTELRQRLTQGREIPDWFTFPEVTKELQLRHRPRHRQGFTVFFTGLSGSGKSTIANILLIKFLEMGGRPVTLLDGDMVRRYLSPELGFSKDHRDINIRRIGFMASEITKNGGICICAPIAPYHLVRKQVREMIQPAGGFILVYLSTPIALCEKRDRKGLYAEARAGRLEQFTGISDPYEVPEDAEVVLDTSQRTLEESAKEILRHLERERYIRLDAD